MLVPADTIAETVDKLRRDNEMYAEQIIQFQKMISDNETTIAAMEPLGTWVETPVGEA